MFKILLELKRIGYDGALVVVEDSPVDSGTASETTVRPSIPAKSCGLHVYNGRSWAIAVAATMAS